MEQQEWKRLSKEEGPNLKLFKVRWDLMRNPRNGASERMIILDSPDSVNVVPVTSNGTILFVEQYRFGTETYTLELPGGIVDQGETHEIGAQRELQEETGGIAQNWSYLGQIPSNPVFMNSYIHHWLATDVVINAPQVLDEGEAVEVIELSISEVKRRLLAGEFQHPHTVNALLRFFSHQDMLQ